MSQYSLTHDFNFVPLSHCDFVLKIFLCVFAPLRLCVKFFALHFRRLAPVYPLRRHPNMHAVASSRASAALSGISRASRQSFVLIQRIARSHPPPISAVKLHKLRNSRIKNEDVFHPHSIFSAFLCDSVVNPYCL